MTVSLDASAIVPLFVVDAFNHRIEAYLTEHTPDIVVSDFAAAEFASVLARRVRMGQSSRADAEDATIIPTNTSGPHLRLIGLGIGPEF